MSAFEKLQEGDFRASFGLPFRLSFRLENQLFITMIGYELYPAVSIPVRELHFSIFDSVVEGKFDKWNTTMKFHL